MGSVAVLDASVTPWGEQCPSHTHPFPHTPPPPPFSSASLRICADGGANRLYDEVTRRRAGSPDGPAHLPTAIVGDLDSIRPEVADFYRSAGVEIVDLSADQDSTDLQKCVEFAAARRGGGGGHIVALGAHGGRLDHILSNLGALYRYRDLELVLVGEGNATRLVRAGSTLLRVAQGREGPACGLVPLAGPARATTKGLRWDMGARMRGRKKGEGVCRASPGGTSAGEPVSPALLLPVPRRCGAGGRARPRLGPPSSGPNSTATADGTEMKMGGLLSTSNIVQGEHVEVHTDADIIWTVQCA